jgi:hypothetical protein
MGYEYCVDLAAMLSGFSSTMAEGRSVIQEKSQGGNGVTTFGYLTDGDFNFAKRRIASLQTQGSKLKQDVSRGVEDLGLLCLDVETTLWQFRAFLRQVDVNPPKRVYETASEQLVSCHDPLRTHALHSELEQASTLVDRARATCSGMDRYYPSSGELLTGLIKQIADANRCLRVQSDATSRDIKTLRRFVGLGSRLRIGFGALRHRYRAQREWARRVR